MVHFPGFDVQPQVERRQHGRPSFQIEFDHFFGSACSDPALADRIYCGPVTQSEVVQLEGAASRREETPECEHGRGFSAVVRTDEQRLARRQVDARR